MLQEVCCRVPCVLGTPVLSQITSEIGLCQQQVLCVDIATICQIHFILILFSYLPWLRAMRAGGICLP